MAELESYLLEKLKSSSFLNFWNIDQCDHPSSTSQQHPTQLEHQEMASVNFTGLTTPELFLETAIVCKSISSSLQHYITDCEDEIVPALVSLCTQVLSSVLTHQFGCYVVMNLLKRSSVFLETVACRGLKHFNTIVTNQFGSRVLEAVAAKHTTFAVAALRTFCKNWEKLTHSIPAIFFLSACIRILSHNPQDIQVVIDRLLLQPTSSRCSKHHKRILVAFAENCSQDQLEILFSIILERRNLGQILEDKYYASCIRILVVRDYHPAVALVTSAMTSRLPSLMCSRYFKVFLMKISMVSNLAGPQAVFEVLGKAVTFYSHQQSLGGLIIDERRYLSWLCLRTLSLDSTLTAHRLIKNICLFADCSLPQMTSTLESGNTTSKY